MLGALSPEAAQGVDNREQVFQQTAGIAHVGHPVVEEQAGHCVGKARIKGKVHMKIPQPWDEGLTAAIDGGLRADTLFVSLLTMATIRPSSMSTVWFSRMGLIASISVTCSMAISTDRDALSPHDRSSAKKKSSAMRVTAIMTGSPVSYYKAWSRELSTLVRDALRGKQRDGLLWFPARILFHDRGRTTRLSSQDASQTRTLG